MDVCPFCGAETVSGTDQIIYSFKCGSIWIKGKVKRNNGVDYPCYEAQIANLQAQLADREERLAAWRNFYKNDGEPQIGWNPSFRNLKSLKEIT